MNGPQNVLSTNSSLRKRRGEGSTDVMCKYESVARQTDHTQAAHVRLTTGCRRSNHVQTVQAGTRPPLCVDRRDDCLSRSRNAALRYALSSSWSCLCPICAQVKCFVELEGGSGGGEGGEGEEAKREGERYGGYGLPKVKLMLSSEFRRT